MSVFRDANPQEQAVYKEFENSVIQGRIFIEASLGGAACLAMLEEWRRDMVASGRLSGGFMPPLFTAGAVELAKKNALAWNEIEEALSGLQLRKYGYQVVPGPDGRADLDIYAFPVETPGIDGWPLILITLGVLIITAAIAEVKILGFENQKDARQAAQKLAEVDERMANAEPDARASYERMKSSREFTRSKGLLERIGEALKGAGMGLGIFVVGGILLWGWMQSSRSSRA